jgi:hypothetical protein
LACKTAISTHFLLPGLLKAAWPCRRSECVATPTAWCIAV